MKKKEKGGTGAKRIKTQVQTPRSFHQTRCRLSRCRGFRSKRKQHPDRKRALEKLRMRKHLLLKKPKTPQLVRRHRTDRAALSLTCQTPWELAPRQKRSQEEKLKPKL